MTKTLGEWVEQFRAMAVGASPGYALAMTDAAAMLDSHSHEPLQGETFPENGK